MSIYSDKLAHVQVVIKSWYLVAQKCTREDMLAHNLGARYFDDVVSYNSLTTSYLIAILYYLLAKWVISLYTTWVFGIQIPTVLSSKTIFTFFVFVSDNWVANWVVRNQVDTWTSEQIHSRTRTTKWRSGERKKVKIKKN